MKARLICETSRHAKRRDGIVTLQAWKMIFILRSERGTRGTERTRKALTLPATCKRTRARAFKSPRRVRTERILLLQRHDSRALSRDSHERSVARAFAASTRPVCVQTIGDSQSRERPRASASIFLSRALLTRASLRPRCSPDIKRRVIAVCVPRACGIEEPARRVRVPLASLISILRFLSQESAERTRSEIKLRV